MKRRNGKPASMLQKYDRFSLYRHSELMVCTWVSATHDPMNRKPMLEVFTGVEWNPYYLSPTTTVYIQENPDAK